MIDTLSASESIAELRSKVSLDGIRRAREAIKPHLGRTPLIRHPLLAGETGLDLHVKHENHLPGGSFKIRGGFNLMAHLGEEESRRGVVTATRGNHGQSIAMAAGRRAIRCVIIVPFGNNPDKNAAMAAYGAEVVEHGKDFDEARQLVDQYVQREGLRSVHAATEPLLINGVGTYSLEILEDLPEIDAVIVPVGGGSGICGAVTVFRALKPGVKIIGVQAENAPCVYRSWMKGELVTTETADTFADGLATRIPFELPFSIMREGVDQMVLVSEEEIRQAILTLLHTTHNLAEGAGAAALAGAVKIADELSAKKVAIVLSGGNIDMKTLRWVLSADPGSRRD